MLGLSTQTRSRELQAREMVDLYTRIREQPQEVIEVIAKSMDTRASEPAMQKICASYMSQIELPEQSRVLEIGCGNGASTKLLLKHLNISHLTGVDPSPRLIKIAKERFVDNTKISFHVGDAVKTEEASTSFDLVIAHTVYSHLPEPNDALKEAQRLLKPSGQLVIFDGDYATTTVSLFENDPLQAAVSAFIRNMVHAPYIMRNLPAMVKDAGIKVSKVKPHGYVQTTSADYLVSLISRSLDAAMKADELGQELADGFVKEARRRVSEGTFYGSIMFLSLMAEKG